MIPQDKKKAVAQALQAIFGVREVEDISLVITWPYPVLVYKMTVLGKPYLLCIGITMESVQDVLYTHAEAGILITGFSEANIKALQAAELYELEWILDMMQPGTFW